MDFWNNVPLMAALIAIFFAQAIKVPIQALMNKRSNWSLLTATGGMPSSHSAAVCALMTVLAIEYGMNSPYFAIAAIFGVIVMFDAMGVRRQSGEQAITINKLIADFQAITNLGKANAEKDPEAGLQRLKEVLGHKPTEVFFGILTGIAIGFLVNYLYHL
ncbi:hypothetical protein BFC20_03345 [Brochothrix thermosphacta]|uniref:divergent PAP2 family protein n=1 Tax=Brochothrix thermosphacta TaxID=2756 RepID=UPI000E70DA9E|nr:divergent PAP2 family protein [Brochothrix thermosphacta]ANZ96836.1 hypothetical protein BFC20_03345 [Brochothrix thermosphacta]